MHINSHVSINHYGLDHAPLQLNIFNRGVNMNNEQTAIIKLEPDGRTTVIKNMTISDEDVYTFLHAAEEKTRVTTLADAVKIGVRGLKQMRTGAELNFVENGFNQMITKFNYALDPNLQSSFFYRFIHLIQDYYDRGGRIEHLLDPSTQNGPLNKLQCELRGEIQKLRDIIIKKETETELIQKTPMKGYDFEDTCENILSEYVSTTIGDDLQRTTKTCGVLTGSFAGDFVLTLEGMTDKKITIETKHVDSITEPQIIKNLEQAMKNRGAKYGILIVKNKEALPKKLGWFHELSGNMMVCAMGNKTSDTQFPQIPSLAIEFAKLRLQKETDTQKETLTMITESITQIGKKLDKFSLIQTQCTNIERATTEIREQTRILKSDITEHVSKMKQIITLPSTNNMMGVRNDD